MKNLFVSRLIFDLATLVLLILALAYWWLGNLAHELIGTAMFALLVRHVFMNRRWFASIRRGSYDRRRSVKLILNLSFAGAMLTLLATSIAISQAVFSYLPIGDYFSLREIHWFAAYWVVAVSGIHIGLNCYLARQGDIARGGQILDASIVPILLPQLSGTALPRRNPQPQARTASPSVATR